MQSNSWSNTNSSSSCFIDGEKDVWYSFDVSQDALLSLEIKLHEKDSLFNNVLSIYSGSCNNLIEVSCLNWDEFGFQGEKAFFNATASEQYFIKVSGLNDELTRLSGKFCISLNTESSTPTAPTYDLCNNAETLIINDNWKSFNNENASCLLYTSPSPRD